MRAPAVFTRAIIYSRVHLGVLLLDVRLFMYKEDFYEYADYRFQAFHSRRTDKKAR